MTVQRTIVGDFNEPRAVVFAVVLHLGTQYRQFLRLALTTPGKTITGDNLGYTRAEPAQHWHWNFGKWMGRKIKN